MRQYLQRFSMATMEQEQKYLCGCRLSRLSPRYPFKVFWYSNLPTFELAPITIFCGGNGSGKSTILNIMAGKLGVARNCAYNRGELLEDYLALCEYELAPGATIPEGSRIITSDDVFDYLLDVRYINAGIDKGRSELFADYYKKRAVMGEEARLHSLDDFDRWREIAEAKTKEPKPVQYVEKRIMDNIQGRSNGESALLYFTREIKENALYLLDEPENSLSAEFQLELKRFLEASVRGYGCQFILSTHSPFLLAIPGAKIYDLDQAPPREVNWTEIQNVKLYHDFFLEHNEEF